MNILRHGDLLLYPIKKEGLKLKKVFEGKKFVLAEGETTGHKHVLTVAPETTKFVIYEDDKGQKYIEMNSQGSLVHEEHKQLTVAPDFYVVKEEQEYSYPDQETKMVLD